MARHARLGWRQTRIARSLHARMAIPAIDPVVLNVVLVAEHDGLFRRDLHTRYPRAAIHNVCEREQGAERKDHQGDRDLGNRVRARSKELCHREALPVEC